MTLDLESLRLVIAVLDYEARTIPADSRDYGPQREQDVEQDIAGARHIVELALAELAARRARDAEVEALVDALRLARNDIASLPRSLAHGITTLPKIDAALLPFTGDKT